LLGSWGSNLQGALPPIAGVVYSGRARVLIMVTVTSTCKALDIGLQHVQQHHGVMVAAAGARQAGSLRARLVVAWL
jgi:hypothetical protein